MSTMPTMPIGITLSALAAVLFVAPPLAPTARAQDTGMPIGHAIPMKDETAAPAPDPSRERSSDTGLFVARIDSAVEPIEINRLHRWTLHVDGADGEPVLGAAIAIDGGMPMHDHGLPTAPRVTEELGAGDYRVEGMKFQMPGHWTVTFTIAADGGEDQVTFDLML